MYEIAKNVVFVKGAKNGAIYDFNSGDVFSVNTDACDIIMKLINNEVLISSENEYKKALINNHLFDNNFSPKIYKPVKNEKMPLNLVWLEITQACNMKCLHCYEGNVHKNQGDLLTIEQWINVIKEIKDLKVKNVVVIGGEPCLFKGLIKILEELINNNINTTLFTNAYFLNKEIMNLIIKNNQIISVKVSIYGHNSEIHDTITQLSGSFDRLHKNITYLIDNHVHVSAAVVLMKENEKYVNEIKNYLQTIKISSYKFDVIRQIYNGTQNHHAPVLSEIRKMSFRTQPCFTTSKKQFDLNYAYNSCWYGKCAITENGKVIPCVFERNITYGNIKYSKLNDILYSIKAQELLQMTYDKIDECNQCEFRYACKDCRPVAMGMNGVITAKSPNCKYSPLKGAWKEI